MAKKKAPKLKKFEVELERVTRKRICIEIEAVNEAQAHDIAFEEAEAIGGIHGGPNWEVMDNDTRVLCVTETK